MAADASTSLTRFENFYGGASVAPLGGQYLTSDDPYTGERWAEIARGGGEDVAAAVAAAKAGLKAWQGLKAAARAGLMIRFAEAA